MLKYNFLIYFSFIFPNKNLLQGVCGETCQHLCNTTSKCDTNPCWFGGICVDATNSEYICICPPNHSGKDCRILLLCQPNSCYNGGICSQTGM